MNAMGIASLSLLALVASPPQTYKVAVEGVRVDVLVTESGRIVRDLTAADFELRDRGALQSAIDVVQAEGATALYDAAYTALMLRDPSPGRQLVLVFADDVDTASWLPGARVIDLAQRCDAVVYGVTLRGPDLRPLGYRADFTSGIQPRLENIAAAAFEESFVKGLTVESGGAVLSAEDSGQLRETFVKIVTEFRSRYVLTYSPRGVEVSGWHPLEVRLKRRSGRVTARRGYLR